MTTPEGLARYVPAVKVLNAARAYGLARRVCLVAQAAESQAVYDRRNASAESEAATQAEVAASAALTELHKALNAEVAQHCGLPEPHRFHLWGSDEDPTAWWCNGEGL